MSDDSDEFHNWVPFMRNVSGYQTHDTCSVCGCVRIFFTGIGMYKYKGVDEPYFRVNFLTCEDQHVYDVLIE